MKPTKNYFQEKKNTLLIHTKFEKDVFTQLNINQIQFDRCVEEKKAYSILLRNFIKDCFKNGESAKDVAENILKSKVLSYIGLKPRT